MISLVRIPNFSPKLKLTDRQTLAHLARFGINKVRLVDEWVIFIKKGLVFFVRVRKHIRQTPKMFMHMSVSSGNFSVLG